MPRTVTLVPGTILCTRVRSTESIRLRGISPIGTSSGFSCNLRTCVSVYLLRSGNTENGSRGHASSPMLLPVRASQVRGIMAPPKPGLHAIILMFLQVLHCSAIWVALDFAREAAMTMPGITTNWEMSCDVRLRIFFGICVLERRICTSCFAGWGSSPSCSSFLAKRRAATTSDAANSNRGRYSAGLVRSASCKSSQWALTSSIDTLRVLGTGS
mmetsp:Transcript_2638/g.4433  ORF Transcript_2638/g.4433 Transcript_2638/m.4433 type:complete len:214 (+) Transcript_2638:1949-2590(+)